MSADDDQRGPAATPTDLAAAVRDNPVWYHTIELAPGVVTPGRIDLRDAAPRVLRDRMAGRALDVGAFDGFWTFEMEKRGADVVAIDVDTIESAEWPPVHRERLERAVREWGIELGKGFRIASEALGSNARRVISNVYDVTPEAIGGPVDFVFSGAILLHLRNPVHALERLYDCLVPGGEIRILEPFSMRLTLTSPGKPAASFQAAYSDFNWWVPNLAGLAAWLSTAGFTNVERIARFRSPAERRMRQFSAAFSARRPG
ncbi:MAG: class I SAM-dependent methyltransferase [Solirubrobacterales bacterium]